MGNCNDLFKGRTPSQTPRILLNTFIATCICEFKKYLFEIDV